MHRHLYFYILLAHFSFLQICNALLSIKWIRTQQQPKYSLTLSISSESSIFDKEDQDLQSYLTGQNNIPWKGTRQILKRKKQIPDPSYSPIQVINLCMNALSINDDPQLDHGCCVLLEFASPNGPLREKNLDPAAYARFLRSSDYSLLIDHNRYELNGDLKTIRNGNSVIQAVDVFGYRDESGNIPSNTFDFFLSQVEGKWFVDVVVLRNS